MDRVESELDWLYRIWVTDYGKCPKRIQLKYFKKEELPVHFIQAKGRILHETIQQGLKGLSMEPDFSIFKDAEIQLRQELAKPLANFKVWLSETELDLKGCEIEKKLEMPLGQGFTLVGKLDLFKPEFIIDFKISRKRNTLVNRVQLAAYRVLALHHGLAKDPKLINVFLGGKTYVSYELKKQEVEAATTEFWSWLEEHKAVLKLIEKGERMPCSISFECVYCPYRHLCRGI